jgi:AcrR family transcriptional regulator
MTPIEPKKSTTDEVPMAAHLARGQRTRERVLSLTIQIAREEGLDALTIGRVAEVSDLTKAGLLGHFASKEALQLATLEAGRVAFVEAVIRPALEAPAGLERVARLLEFWVEHIDDRQGGCFFASVAAEYDSRTGPVKESIAKMLSQWTEGIEHFLKQAQERKQLSTSVDLSALSFELHGFELSLNLRRQLFGDHKAAGLAKRAMRRALYEAATPSGRKALDETWPPRGLAPAGKLQA